MVLPACTWAMGQPRAHTLGEPVSADGMKVPERPKGDVAEVSCCRGDQSWPGHGSVGGVDVQSQAEQNMLVPEHLVTSAFLIEKLPWITNFPAEPKDAEQPFFLEMEGSFASTSLRLH